MNIDQYLDKFPEHLRHIPAMRRQWTKDDCLMFVLVYLQSSIRFDGEQPSLAQFHLDLADYAQTLTTDKARRDAWIAPRESGKSTWLFKLIPLWLAAHGHSKFIAAFSDSATQAEQHLATFSAELQSNQLLRLDYPELIKPMMRGTASRFVSQSRSQIQQANGFSFVARGIDAKTLGLKIGNSRPDYLLLDDVEGDASSYSENDIAKRKHTILSSVMFLASRANVAIVGTTTTQGSLIDQIRTVGELRAEHAELLSSRGADSEIQSVVNENSYRQSLSNISADNLDYVNLPKDWLTLSNIETGTSDALRSIEHALGQSVPEHTKTSPQSDTAMQTEATENDTSDKIDLHLSNVEDGIECHDNVSALLPSQVLATQRSGHDLTDKLTDVIGPEIDLKFQTPEKRMSTSLANTDNFEKVEHTELARLGLIDVPNRAEHELEQRQYVSDTLELATELQWVEQQNIDVHYYPAIVIDDQGKEQSWWPESKSMAELNKQRHTAEFALNMMNTPRDLSGAYWNTDDIHIAEFAGSYRVTIISIDPAVTTAKSSDYTAVAVLSVGTDGLVYVRHAEQLRIVSTELLEHVNELVTQFDASVVIVETNQGGDMWRLNVFDGLKAKFLGIRQQEKKEIRISRSLDYYRKQQVVHTRHFSALEAQMYSYPKTQHDDLLDSVATGVHMLLSSSGGMSIKKRSYT